MESPTFRVSGDATWVVEDNDVSRQRSELRLQLTSSNIAPTLEALGYDPVVEGEKASVTLDLFWPGGPRDDFERRAANALRGQCADQRVLVDQAAAPDIDEQGIRLHPCE